MGKFEKKKKFYLITCSLKLHIDYVWNNNYKLQFTMSKSAWIKWNRINEN